MTGAQSRPSEPTKTRFSRLLALREIRIVLVWPRSLQYSFISHPYLPISRHIPHIPHIPPYRYTVHLLAPRSSARPPADPSRRNTASPLLRVRCPVRTRLTNTNTRDSLAAPRGSRISNCGARMHVCRQVCDPETHSQSALRSAPRVVLRRVVGEVMREVVLVVGRRT